MSSGDTTTASATETPPIALIIHIFITVLESNPPDALSSFGRKMYALQLISRINLPASAFYSFQYTIRNAISKEHLLSTEECIYFMHRRKYVTSKSFLRSFSCIEYEWRTFIMAIYCLYQAKKANIQALAECWRNNNINKLVIDAGCRKATIYDASSKVEIKKNYTQIPENITNNIEHFERMGRITRRIPILWALFFFHSH